MSRLYWVWLPLLAIRTFLSGYFGFDTLVITIALNILLAIDFIFVLIKESLAVKKIALFFLIGGVIVLFNKAALGLLDIVMAVYILRGMTLERLIKIMSFISVMILLQFAILFYFNVNENIVVRMPKGEAQSLGFGNTNTASAFFMTYFMIIALHLYNIKKTNSFFIIPAFYGIYLLTLGRTSFYAEMVFYISMVLLLIPGVKKFKFFYRVLPLLLFVALVSLTYLSNTYSEINQIFTTRFSIYNEVLSLMAPLNYIVGIAIPEGQPMDSSFFALLFDGGIVYLALFLLMYDKYYRNHIRYNDFHYMPFVLFMLATGFSENTFSSFGFLSIVLFKIFYDVQGHQRIKI